MKKFDRRIKFEARLERNFVKEVAGYPGCEGIYECIQCGTCSSTCPVSLYMDYTPRKIVAMVRGGFREEVLNCFTIWLCASCYSCAVNCPMKLKITDIMYTLKQIAMKEGQYPSRFPVPVLAKEFIKMVKRNGRINEGVLATLMMLKTNPVRILGYSTTGLKLFLKGRIGLELPKVSDPKQLKKMIEALEARQ